MWEENDNKEIMWEENDNKEIMWEENDNKEIMWEENDNKERAFKTASRWQQYWSDRNYCHNMLRGCVT